jgi:hypothetical protein
MDNGLSRYPADRHVDGRMGETRKKSKKYDSTLSCRLVLLNVSGEDLAKKLWDKLGSLYQSKYLVNKLFLRKKLYLLRMSDGSLVTEHLNVFNTILSQLSSVDIKITEEEKCIILLCSFPDSWDSLVMAIGSNTTTLVLEDVVASLLSEEMRRKNMEGSTKDALVVRGRPIERDKGKFSGRNSKSKGRSKSLGSVDKKMLEMW